MASGAQESPSATAFTSTRHAGSPAGNPRRVASSTAASAVARAGAGTTPTGRRGWATARTVPNVDRYGPRRPGHLPPAAAHNRRSHLGRYQTHRQPGAAAQYTDRCPEGRGALAGVLDAAQAGRCGPRRPLVRGALYPLPREWRGPPGRSHSHGPRSSTLPKSTCTCTEYRPRTSPPSSPSRYSRDPDVNRPGPPYVS
jgi:hypothetical protein